jgi:DNA-binding GntR family transcriptional regulator
LLARPRPPLYYLVYKSLERRIRDHCRVGERLPSEDALCREFEVSRMTVRQALGGLVDAGLLTRRRGSGSYVSATGERRVSGQMELTGALEDLFAEANAIRADKAHVAEEIPPPEIQQLLGLVGGEPVTVIRRVRVIEGQPLAFTVNYVRRELGRRLSQHHLDRFPLMRLLEEQLHVRFDRADQTVEARLADEAVASVLGIDFGDPVLFAERLMFDRGGHPIEVVRSHYRADSYCYRIRFVRSARAHFQGALGAPSSSGRRHDGS